MKKAWLIFFVFLMITACSTNTKNDLEGTELNNNNEQPSSDQQDEGSASAPDNMEPDSAVTKLTLENDGIDQTEFADAVAQFPETVAERIVTTSVPLAEMMHLLGITPVGVPTSTNPLPAEFDEVQRIGSPMGPDLEIIASLEADLMLGAESLRSTVEAAVSDIDLETAFLRTDSFDDLKLSFKVLGSYFDKQEQMNETLSSILEKENELMNRLEGQEAPSVLLIIGTSDSFMVMSEQSYLGSLVKRLGADNIATSVLQVSSTYSAINLEDIVAADPDIIMVLASGDHGAAVDKFDKEVENNDVWTRLSAYQNDRIHIMDYSIFGVTSIANVETALTTIADYMFE